MTEDVKLKEHLKVDRKMPENDENTNNEQPPSAENDEKPTSDEKKEHKVVSWISNDEKTNTEKPTSDEKPVKAASEEVNLPATGKKSKTANNSAVKAPKMQYEEISKS